MSYQPKVYKEQGGDVLVVKAQDGGVIKGQATADGTPAQAATIAAVTATHDFNATFDDAELEAAVNANAAAINSILTALKNVGIVALS